MNNLSDAHTQIYRELVESKEMQKVQAEQLIQLEKSLEQMLQINDQLSQRLEQQRQNELNLREETERLNQLIKRQNLQSQMLEEGFARMKEKADRAADWQRMYNEKNGEFEAYKIKTGTKAKQFSRSRVSYKTQAETNSMAGSKIYICNTCNKDVVLLCFGKYCFECFKKDC